MPKLRFKICTRMKQQVFEIFVTVSNYQSDKNIHNRAIIFMYHRLIFSLLNGSLKIRALKALDSLGLSYWEYLESCQIIIELFIVINWSFHHFIVQF